MARQRVRWCQHCDLAQCDGPRRYCRACRAYKHRTGQLPPARIIRRRLERSELDRLEQQAWGRTA